MNDDSQGNGRDHAPEAPHVLHEVKIQIMSDQTIRVVDFPREFDAAIELFTDATKIVTRFFMTEAISGRIRQAPKNSLLIPKPGLIIPGRN